jgi:cell division protein FtsW
MIISQVLLNIAVAAGALPVTGVTLPFFSHGGSSLATTLVMAGLVVNVSRFRESAPRSSLKPNLDEEGS